MLKSDRKKRMLLVLLLWFFLSGVLGSARPVQAAGRLQDAGEKLVVVIDPGHGGENLGTIENGFLEKSMTMTTALAMYEELCKFEGVEVYLTHTQDKDMSLKKRAEFAEQKEADLLVSIHYNASGTHLLFGSEVWISLEPPYHAYGYQFATVAMREFREIGMNLRGIKTRPDSKGADYYGIIRESVALGVPAVILEHCHVDHPTDSLHCDTEEERKAYGVTDAHAVAKYFGLKSDALNVDYSAYPESLPDIPPAEIVPRAKYDGTPPESCSIEVKEAFYSEGRVQITVNASDPESNLIYFAYSLDGGKNFSPIVPWAEGDILTGEFDNTFQIELAVADGANPHICFRAYNAYDLYTDSNLLIFPEKFRRTEPLNSVEFTILPKEETPLSPQPEGSDGESSAAVEFEDVTDQLLPAGNPGAESQLSVRQMLDILKICIPVVLLIFLILLTVYLISKVRAKDPGDSRDQAR